MHQKKKENMIKNWNISMHNEKKWKKMTGGEKKGDDTKKNTKKIW